MPGHDRRHRPDRRQHIHARRALAVRQSRVVRRADVRRIPAGRVGAAEGRRELTRRKWRTCPMHCHTCNNTTTLARKVRLLDLVEDDDPHRVPLYVTRFVCAGCYEVLNNVDGIGLIDGKLYRLDDASRFGKAAFYTSDMYDDYQQREALTLKS